MRHRNHCDDILAVIDGILPPEQEPRQDEIVEVSGLLQPQFEMIVALSGLQDVTSRRDFVDVHHLFWPRTNYRTTLEKTFRRQFVLPINRGVHDEVHAQLEPPVKPNRRTMLGYLALLDKKDSKR